MGFSNFISNLKRKKLEKDTLIREYMPVMMRHRQMMKELNDNIKYAETPEEKEEFKALKQRIIDEGKRVENELKNKK